MSDLEKFDPSMLMQGVRDRIKATFVSMIPDDQWEKLVEVECHKFFATDSYRQTSPFKELCNDIIRELARERVRALIADYKSDIWDQNGLGLKPSELLIKAITENASKIFASAFASMFQNVVNGMHNGN